MMLAQPNPASKRDCPKAGQPLTSTLWENMDIPAPAYATISTISAATIAGGISFLIAVLSKDQKTSEFRQAWIDGLRSEIAELVSIFIVISDTARVMNRHGKTKEEIFEHFAEKKDYFCKWQAAEATIKLRLNPIEHEKLLVATTALQKSASSGLSMDSSAVDALVDNIISESQVVLKSEWKRVKRGEPVFIVTKVISLFIMVTSISLWVVYANGHLHIELLP